MSRFTGVSSENADESKREETRMKMRFTGACLMISTGIASEQRRVVFNYLGLPRIFESEDSFLLVPLSTAMFAVVQLHPGKSGLAGIRPGPG